MLCSVARGKTYKRGRKESLGRSNDFEVYFLDLIENRAEFSSSSCRYHIGCCHHCYLTAKVLLFHCLKTFLVDRKSSFISLFEDVFRVLRWPT